jgi:hypothetical protein
MRSSSPSPAISSTTLAQTRSIVQHDLKPHLGDTSVHALTTIDIDDVYRWLSRCSGRDGRPLTPGTVPASTSCCIEP